MSTSAPYFFMSYSREDATLQRRIIAALRGRGIHVWVDVENLIPGSPAWEREIERSIRAAAGVIVLLSPDSSNSEWVRREISFAEQNDKRIFPVLVEGNEDDSIPLRLSNHQRVDLRRNFEGGLDELANALRDHLGATLIGIKQKKKKSANVTPADLKKFALPGLIALIGIACIGMLVFAARSIYRAARDLPTPASATSTATAASDTLTPDTDPLPTNTAIVINQNLVEPAGKIVFTCQVQGDEVCIMNANGSGWRRVTDSPAANYYGSLSPDGESILYIGKDTDHTEVYEMVLDTGKTRQLTKLKKDLGSPEISPDNKFITFTYRASNNRLAQIWIMNRDGSDPHELYSSSSQDAHDATWSPDGAQILFAMGKGENNKLYIMDFNGRDPQLLNDSIDTRGRSDWSIRELIALDMGGPFQHNIYLINTDGSRLTKFSDGNNSQGASFSPDGEWIAFTAYTDVANKDQSSCEIYIMRVDGTDQRRLTNNGYCDYQPRWGN